MSVEFGEEKDSPAPASENQRRTKFDHLDATATALTDILRVARIPHVYIGGYAVTLLGGDRVTQDVDVPVDRSCRETLSSSSLFTRSTDDRLVFTFKDCKVCIDLHVGFDESDRDSCWEFPRSRDSWDGKSRQTTIYGGELKIRPVV
ncbi:hypothetical protein N7478_011958 [Penicillium angulare]|uniref:uncharacterized protein n=1 Tax=Penicillium angulare TaxID=116970 RepID=UPI0025424378|nr:uncharacterized protein N7478_011958 [Penicillium angulare]KAJ5261363.1 hypothetical protein N7478_011958 [Penicillium angulare]